MCSRSWNHSLDVEQQCYPVWVHYQQRPLPESSRCSRTSCSLQVCTRPGPVLATRVKSSPPDVTSRMTPVTTSQSRPLRLRQGGVSPSATVGSSLPVKAEASSGIRGKCSAVTGAPIKSSSTSSASVHSSSVWSSSSSSSITVSPPSSSLLVQPVASYLPVLPSVNLSSFPVMSPTSSSPSPPTRKSSNSSPANIADCRPLLSYNRFTKTSDKSSTIVGKCSADEPLFRYVPKLNPKSPSMKKWMMSFKKGKASYKKIQQTLPSRSWGQQSSSSSSGNQRYNDIDLLIWRPFSTAPCQVLDRALMDRNAKILTLRETEDSVDSFSREMSDMMRTDEISNSSVGGQVLDSASFCTGSKIVSTGSEVGIIGSEFDIMGSETDSIGSVEAGLSSQDMQSRQNAVNNAKRKLFCSSSSNNNNKTIPFKKRFSLNVTKKPSKESTTCTTTAAAERGCSPERRGQKLRQKKKTVGQVPEENSRRSSTRGRNPLQKLSSFEDTIVQLGQILMLFMSSNLKSTTKLMHSSKQALLMEYAGLCYITALPTASGVRLRKTSASRAPIPLDLEWMLSED